MSLTYLLPIRISFLNKCSFLINRTHQGDTSPVKGNLLGTVSAPAEHWQVEPSILEYF